MKRLFIAALILFLLFAGITMLNIYDSKAYQAVSGSK